jgi:serine/threonine protein kinase
VQCKRTNLPVPVAVKMVKIENSDTEDEEMTTSSSMRELKAKTIANQIETLRIELSIMAYLQRQKVGQHPNLIRLIGTTIDEDNQFYLMTEYCEYGSLHGYLQKKYQNKQFVKEITNACNDTDHESNQLLSNVRKSGFFSIVETGYVDKILLPGRCAAHILSGFNRNKKPFCPNLA